jgi:hypothetical protein
MGVELKSIEREAIARANAPLPPTICPEIESILVSIGFIQNPLLEGYGVETSPFELVRSWKGGFPPTFR